MIISSEIKFFISFAYKVLTKLAPVHFAESPLDASTEDSCHCYYTTKTSIIKSWREKGR